MKKAFTLAEILLVLLIVSILLTLCMGAGRVHLEKAYNLYYYRSYAGLCAVFNDFLYQGKHHEYKLVNATTHEYQYVGRANVATEFKSRVDELTQNGRGGINYEGYNTVGDYFIEVIVTVPALKSSQNTEGKNKYKVLLTTGYNLRTAGEPQKYLPMIMISDDGGTGILDSVGILPAFLDDGEVGTYAYNSAGELKYKPIIQMSLREAFCTRPKVYEKSPTGEGTGGNLYNNLCNGKGITVVDEKQNYTVKLLKPAGYRG